MDFLSEEKVFRAARMNLESPVSDERRVRHNGSLSILNCSITCIPLSISNEMEQTGLFQTLSGSVENSRVTHGS